MRGAHRPRQKFQYRESIHTRQLALQIERGAPGQRSPLKDDVPGFTLKSV
jgi:hypothetical protein